MTASSKFKINGIPITLICDGWEIDGVVVHPNVYSEHDSKDIANAIEYAATIWHELRDYAWVYDHLNEPMSNYYFPNSEAKDRVSICLRAINSQVFKLSDNQLIDAYRIIDELEFFITNGFHKPVQSTNEKKFTRTPKPGHIYLIQAITPDNHYKIGLSKEPVTRIESMGVKLPFPVDTLHTFETDDMTQTEKILHERFADKRVNGEWFELDEGDVNYFRSISGWFGGQVFHD